VPEQAFCELEQHSLSFSLPIKLFFAYFDTLRIPRIHRAAVSYFLQMLPHNGRFISANTYCHTYSNNSWSFEQWLVFENGFWNTTQTRFHILPAQSKLSEQTSLSVSRERDKQLRIRQGAYTIVAIYSKLNTQLKRTTAIQLQLQCWLASCKLAHIRVNSPTTKNKEYVRKRWKFQSSDFRSLSL